VGAPKPPPDEKPASRTGPARILGLPMWQGISAIAAILSLAIGIVVAVWPRAAPRPESLGSSPRLELDGVQVHPKISERHGLPSFADQVYFSLRNTGNQLAIITGLKLQVQQFAQVPECYSSGSLGTTGWSTVELPAKPSPGQTVTVPVSQQVAPDSADKFEVSIHVSKNALGIHLYRLQAWIIYDKQVALKAGYLLASLPVQPQDGGYYWTRQDQADPGRLRPFTSNLQSLSHCLISNSERLRGILSLPGNRSAGLTSLPATLAFRY
jgi:hypothetical protein